MKTLLLTAMILCLTISTATAELCTRISDAKLQKMSKGALIKKAVTYLEEGNRVLRIMVNTDDPLDPESKEWQLKEQHTDKCKKENLRMIKVFRKRFPEEDYQWPETILDATDK